ncbi:putative acyltransferase [Yersinia intermedia]|uniref:Putative acyltransferase n=1 Tax=Yersinia intermedia TaxID=631 RepID=A0A0H5LY20_YERIN|nr:GNAT family N-acetyltransferase [Yersinia intermedia]CRY55797.1 putative acyltransferase [Yersinia intermedia]
MLIQRFSIGDETALFRVFFSAVHEIASQDYTKKQLEAWAPTEADPNLWAKQVRDLHPFIVEVNKEIVGYADLQANGYIDHFYVASAHSRQGVGTLLMKRLHEEANLLGICELTSQVSKTAEPFFILHGFHVVERGFPVRQGVTLENAVMRKILCDHRGHAIK